MAYYESAPACFTMLVDSTVLVEQYHYGKIDAGTLHDTLLGKDMPLLEFKNEPHPLYKEERDSPPLRNPYQLMKHHFEFVEEHAEPVPLTS